MIIKNKRKYLKCALGLLVLIGLLPKNINKNQPECLPN